jgi:hypothetical protein
MDAMETPVADPSIDRLLGQVKPFHLPARHNPVLTPRDLSQLSIHTTSSRGGVCIYPPDMGGKCRRCGVFDR